MRNIQAAVFLAFCLLSPIYLSAQKTVRYELPAFSEISLRNEAKIVLKQDSIQSVTVKAKEETISKLIVEIKDRKLIIRNSPNTWFSTNWNPGEIIVNISVPQLDQLSISGSGSILADDRFESRILDLYLSGSGSIKMKNLKSEKVSASISGSGSIKLSGDDVVTEFKANLSGSGGVSAAGLKARNVNVLISGSGSSTVHATENLIARVAGSGGVTYFGNPQVESTIVGSGSVKAGK